MSAKNQRARAVQASYDAMRAARPQLLARLPPRTSGERLIVTS
jgi:hypothetical protein